MNVIIKRVHCTVISGILRVKLLNMSGCLAQSVACLNQEPEVSGSISGQAIYFRFCFCKFKKGSCQLLVKVCAQSTGY